MTLVVDPCLTPAQHRLRDLISDISEACSYAGWAGDTEFAVWRLATEGGSWGRASATELQGRLDEVLNLAKTLGVWVVWSTKPGCDNEPLDLGQWQSLYAGWREASGTHESTEK